MIDEIIETDPDEALHHPIVDDDGYEEDDYLYDGNENESKKFQDEEESKEFGYDSKFFKKRTSPPKITSLPDSS